MKHVSGFKEAEAVLRRMPQRVENRVLQAATMAGARVFRKSVKAAAPRSSNKKRSPSSKQYKHLFQNIKVQRLKSLKRKGRRGARVTTGDGFWGFFIEFGTRFISARPWFRPAISSATDGAVAKLKEALGNGIEREAAKLAKEHGVK